MQIPRIIHQIWSGIDGPLPEHFGILGETWKRDYPDWRYELWDNKRINQFIQEYYPEYYDWYNEFPYNVQRWDIIRYLILYKMGGMYVDFDYESFLPMNELIAGKECCFASEIEYRDVHTGEITDVYYNNALMLAIPGHWYMKKILNFIFSEDIRRYNPRPKDVCVLNTTGPRMLYDLHKTLTDRERMAVFLLPTRYVTPFSVEQAMKFKLGYRGKDLEDALEEAYALHYFFGSWLYSQT